MTSVFDALLYHEEINWLKIIVFGFAMTITLLLLFLAFSGGIRKRKPKQTYNK
jgi:hypothetical protein